MGLFDFLKKKRIDEPVNQSTKIEEDVKQTTTAMIADSSTEFAEEETGVIINGVKWATRNVDNQGRFVAKPEATGMLYQWNRKKAWAAIGETVNGWSNSDPSGTIWEKVNDPSPVGWRIPTIEEIGKLFDKEKVINEWTTVNSVNGRKFTDKATGKSIFLPAVGCRSGRDGSLYGIGSYGDYWSSTQSRDFVPRGAYSLHFYDSNSHWESCYDKACGYSIRSVAE